MAWSLLTVALLGACAGRSAASQTAPAPTGAFRDLQLQTGPALWKEIEGRTWFGGGQPTPEGDRLLNVLRDFNTATPDQKRALLDDYPDGLDAEREAAGRRYESLAGVRPQEAFLAPWLVDGIDDYERALLELQATKSALPATLVRRALSDGTFRAAYDAMPSFLDEDFLRTVGGLPPTLWNHIVTQPWYKDGVSDAELSLLTLVASLNTSGEQLNIIDNNLYRFVPLKEGQLAVISDSRDVTKARSALETAAPILPAIEAFAGPYPSRAYGLWFEIDDTRLYGSECFAGGYDDEPAEIFLATPFCFQRGPMVHEIAHTFFRGTYPTWFAEGVAELVAFHITGTRSGYGDGKGLISTDLRLRLSDDRYYNEASLGARFLVSAYKLLGPDAMSTYLRQVRSRDLKGRELLDLLMASAPPEKRPALRSLISAFFPSGV